MSVNRNFNFTFRDRTSCVACFQVLCGDHKQLGPIVESQFAEQLGLGRSMLERIYNERFALGDVYDSIKQEELKEQR